ncbi:class II aldolase/adducin domain-containing protein [Xylaria venustula]|nr:class II aldolase/adducin domain-containing protein [Xylaria venustula]
MPPSATEVVISEGSTSQYLTGKERANRLKAGGKDRPLDAFTYGGHPTSGHQTKPITQIRIPEFASLEDEREWRKLHHAAALRWLGINGYNNEGTGGHVTVHLCLVNESGEVVEPGNMHAVNPASYAIHVAVHQARPDVVAACHYHSVLTRTFSALGCKLEPINQDACRFYEDHAIYEGFGGIVLAHEEGRRISRALGKNKVIILANHGILTVAKSVDAAVFLFGAMDRCIQAQLLADAAAAGRGTKTIKVGYEEATYTRRIYTDETEYNMFQSGFEDVVRASNGELPMFTGKEIQRTD